MCRWTRLDKAPGLTLALVLAKGVEGSLYAFGDCKCDMIDRCYVKQTK